MARTIKDTEQLVEDAHAAFDTISEDNSIACIIVAGAALEQAVASLLKKHLITGDTTKGLFGLSGVLGDFSSCAKVAYCLGLIEKPMFANLITIADIRNLVAHSHQKLDFTSAAIKELCMSLVPPAHLRIDLTDFPDMQNIASDPRSRFRITVAFLWSRMISTARQEKHRERRKDRW